MYVPGGGGGSEGAPPPSGTGPSYSVTGGGSQARSPAPFVLV